MCSVLGVGVVMHVLHLPDERYVVLIGAARAYTNAHEIRTMLSAHYSTLGHYNSHILRFCSPLVTVQNTICGSAHYCSPDDGHNDARNMLR